MALCGTGLIIAGAAVQFYQPNRAARLVVSLKSKARYDKRPVVVTVMLSNQSQEPLLINKRMRFNHYPLDGEIAFVIEGPGGKPFPLLKVVSPREVNDVDLEVLKVGETMEQMADLTDMYGIRKSGKYKVQAIYYNQLDRERAGLHTWRGSLASDKTEFILD
jgi:hypothetical protein